MSDEKKPIDEVETSAISTSDVTPDAPAEELSDAELENVSGGQRFALY